MRIRYLILILVFAPLIPLKAQFTLNSTFGNLSACDTMTRGIYVVWWDKDFNYSSQVDVLLDSMISYRTKCLTNLSMVDPPNPLAGYYYNVYIHKPGDANDIFQPYNWGNGQGTDGNGYPFLTLPNGVLNDWVNNAHETFHVFQYNANSPGYAYSGNSQWYIEGSANWFAGRENLGAPRAWVEAEALVRVPHVPLWLSYGNYPSYYPSNWQRYVHQYASALLMYYLTDVAGVPDSIITEGFFNGTNQLPQEYLYNTIGGMTFRNHFIDWAAHMTNHFDFILPNQAQTNENEWNTYADAWDDNEFTATYVNTGSNGWVRPHDSLVTCAWSFNTFKVRNSITESYTFVLRGDATGSYGDSAHFQAKVVVLNDQGGATFNDLNMSNATDGTLGLSVSPSDTALCFIIASMPETFRDNNPVFQTFSYEMEIVTGLVGIEEDELKPSPIQVARYNLLGQKVRRGDGGIQLIRYDDGTVRKVFEY